MDVFDILVKVGVDTKGVDSGLSGVKSKLSGFGSAFTSGFATIAKAGVAAIGTATAALGGFAASSVKTGMDFDKSMSQVAATLGLSMDEMSNSVGTAETSFGHFEGNLREFAQFMGQNTAFSATQAADALNYMALAGYDTQKSMDMLPNVLNLAAAGGMELAQASDMITDSQSALGLTMDQTTNLVDQMAQTASKSNTSVAQLGEAILTVGGTAKTLKGGTTELSAALGILADNGTKASEGGTALRNVLTTLTGSKFEKTFGKMGVDAYDAEGKMRSLKDILADMNGVMEGMTDEEKTSLINSTFNARDLKNVNALLATSTDRWDELTGAIENSEGAAAKMAETQLDNLDGDITLLKSAFEGAQIAVSDKLTPALREFVQGGTEGLTKITDAFTEGGFEGAIGAFSEVFSEAVGQISEQLPAVVDAAIQLLTALGGALVDNAPIILNALAQIGTQLLNEGMKLGQLVLDGFLSIDWDSGFSEIGSFVTNAFSPENMNNLATVGFDIINKLVEGIGSAAVNLLPAAITAIENFATGLNNNFDMLLPTAEEVIKKLADGIIQALPHLLNAAYQILNFIVKAAIAALGLFFVLANEIIVKLCEGIYNSLAPLAQAAEATIKEYIEKAKAKFTEIVTAGRELIDKFITGIKEKFTAIRTTAAEVIQNIKDAIKEKIAEATQWGKDMIDNFVKGIKSGMANVKAALSKLGELIKSLIAFSEPKDGPLSNFHTYAPDMMALFAKGIKDNTDMVTAQIRRSFDFEDVINGENFGFNIDTADAAAQLRVASANDETKVLARMDAMLSVMTRYFPEIAEKAGIGAGINGTSFYDRSLGDLLT